MRHVLASSVTPSKLFANSSSASMSRGTGGGDTAATTRSRNRPMSTGYVVFFTFYEECQTRRKRDAPGRPVRRVPSTTFWWLDGDEFLGRLAIRHRLTPFLLKAGGHIGYDVRPGARRRGHATA